MNKYDVYKLLAQQTNEFSQSEQYQKYREDLQEATGWSRRRSNKFLKYFLAAATDEGPLFERIKWEKEWSFREGQQDMRRTILNLLEDE